MKTLWAILSVAFPMTVLAADKPQQTLKPDLADAHYGPHALQVFDLWKAKSKEPTPLVVHVHGGGFYTGNKGVPDDEVKAFLDKGISYMDINYRLAEVKFPEHFMDCARAIQFARSNAQAWNIDPKRIAGTGASAGGAICLWLAFHDDMAALDNADPVLRQSTRLTCVAIHSAGGSLDPRVAKELLGDIVLKHRFFNGKFWGLKPEEFDTPKAHELFKASSPLTYLTKDDPLVWATYGTPADPLDITSAIHHRNHGIYLKKKMDEVEVECVLITEKPKKGEASGPKTLIVESQEKGAILHRSYTAR